MTRWHVVLPALLILAPVLASPAIGSFHETIGVVAEREYVLVMRGSSFNGFEHPDTPLLEAFLGERVRFTVIVPPLAAEPHTFHLHGHPWLLPDTGQVIDTILLQPGEAHAFFVDAGSIDRQPGDWMYHCHIDEHTAHGMWGIFRVYPFSVAATFADDGALTLRAHRLGVPVDLDDVRLTLDGAPVPAHLEALGDGRHVVHAGLPAGAAGTLVVTATSAAWGESVARVGIGGALPEAPSLPLGGHGGHAVS